MEHAETVTPAPFPCGVPALRGRTGEAAWKGVAASLLLHLFVGAAAIGALPAPASVDPPVIDLTLAGPVGETPGDTTRLVAVRVRAAKVPATGARSGGTPAPILAVPETPAVTAAEPAMDTGSVPAPGPAAPPLEPAAAIHPARISPSNFSSPTAREGASAAAFAESLPADPAPPVFAGNAGSRNPVAPNGRAATAGGGGSGITGIPSGESGAGRPLEDFAGIRDGIQRGIAYPAVARKMGWEGKVLVAFLLRPDGTVRDVRVVQGSGHAVLDRGAVEAVRNASPFPRPPVEAEIVTPVIYRLSAAP